MSAPELSERDFHHLLPVFDGWRRQLAALRDKVRTGAPVPVQRNHCWELVDAVDRPPPPFQDGSVVCSPAATAAALSRGDVADPSAVEYLRASSSVLGGAQPVVLPLTIFERSWLVNAAVAAGLAIPRPLRDRIVDGLRAVLDTGRGRCRPGTGRARRGRRRPLGRRPHRPRGGQPGAVDVLRRPGLPPPT